MGQPIDYKTMSQYRALLREKNAQWCPDPATRLQTQVQTHFVERLYERFDTNEARARVLIDTMAWIKANYAMLQRESTWDRKMQHRIHCRSGTSVIILFNGCITLRTCWLYEPQQKDN